MNSLTIVLVKVRLLKWFLKVSKWSTGKQLFLIVNDLVTFVFPKNLYYEKFKISTKTFGVGSAKNRERKREVKASIDITALTLLSKRSESSSELQSGDRTPLLTSSSWSNALNTS